MQVWFRRVLLTGCALLGFVWSAGCATHERRERTVIMETHESEPVEVAPGEMVP